MRERRRAERSERVGRKWKDRDGTWKATAERLFLTEYGRVLK